jgi:CBS domain-containing protein
MAALSTPCVTLATLYDSFTGVYVQPEQIEIQRFLQRFPPFDELSDDALSHLAMQVEIAYHIAGSDILNYGEPAKDLFVVRSGAVETFRRNGELFNRLDIGGVFGQTGLMMRGRVRFPTRALEDSLVYCIPAELFNDYFDQHEKFSNYFEVDNVALLHQSVVDQTSKNDLTTDKAKTLLKRGVVTVTKSTAISKAALIMTQEQVTSLLITDPDKPIESDPEDDDGQAIGIITDRDFITRVIAQELDLKTPISEVMSENMVTLDENAYVYEVMLAMLRFNVHHLPILKKKKPIGVITLADIVRYESQSSLFLVRGIFAQQTVAELASYAHWVPEAFVRMVNEDANSHMIGSAMSVIGRSFKQRLLELAEETLGKPPIPYCFLALGSMARDEQLLITDQDNAIIFDDSYVAELHDEYFSALTQFVCDGLNACGYTYCTGDIMATNPKWQLTLSQWKDLFSQWMADPDPEALLHCSIFFDLDSVWGRVQWADELRQHIATRAKGNLIFLAALARNALSRKPPLGFFKEFVMEKDGQHNNTINLKRRGTAPLTDVIRVHALAVGSRARNSFERLEDIIDTKLLPDGNAQDLSDALEYLSIVRVRHQAFDVNQKLPPDNNIEPDKLSRFERRNLKEAFQVLSAAQNFLKYRYTANTVMTGKKK